MTKIGWPLARNIIRRSSLNHTFGMVRRNAVGSRRPHQGWDFEAEPGYRCYAVADGAIEAVRDFGDYGKQVILRFEYDFDDDGDCETLFAFYAHLSRIDVKVGQKVKLGDQLGLTGNTGNAQSMRGADQHLHFELRSRPLPGRGLDGRYSPLVLFRVCPLNTPIYKTN
jgi:peptidoglycan LD-endopeptidase LytH